MLIQRALAGSVCRRTLRWLGDHRNETALGLYRSRPENRIQGQSGVGVVWRALDPSAQAINRAGNERQRSVASRDFRVEKAAIAAGTAVGRKLQIAMENLLDAAVRVRFPDGAAPTLRTFVKDRLAPVGESQIHTPLRNSAGIWPQFVAARGSNAVSHLCLVGNVYAIAKLA
jgi:hypothetical protein